MKVCKHKESGDRVTVMTFEEFVTFAKSSTPEPHWHIKIGEYGISHENDNCYIIPTPHLNYPHAHFTPKDVLVISSSGNLTPVPLTSFYQEYQLDKHNF